MASHRTKGHQENHTPQMTVAPLGYSAHFLILTRLVDGWIEPCKGNHMLMGSEAFDIPQLR